MPNGIFSALLLAGVLYLTFSATLFLTQDRLVFFQQLIDLARTLLALANLAKVDVEVEIHVIHLLVTLGVFQNVVDVDKTILALIDVNESGLNITQNVRHSAAVNVAR